MDRAVVFCHRGMGPCETRVDPAVKLFVAGKFCENGRLFVLVRKRLSGFRQNPRKDGLQITGYNFLARLIDLP
ncbi:hypothetical protein Barb4_04670 [Bacteroidales bacterium Barb4]|nr:hypothetical protein Barb4_04670 [Bacteroidales bacterium Barb4]